MPLSADFYRRRVEDRLATDQGADARRPVPWPKSEADLTDVRGDAEFVQQAFRLYLKRDPDLEGLTFFCDLAGKQGREAVLDGIRNSDEGRQRASAEQSAGTAPPAAAPGPTDAAHAGVVASGDDSAAALDDSPELADLLAIADQRRFVTAAYLRTLGRPPDPDGLEHYLGRLAHGDDRATILHGLAGSPEAAARGKAFTWRGQPWRGPSFMARVRAAALRVMPGRGVRRHMTSVESSVRALGTRLDRHASDQRERQDAMGRQLEALAAAVDRLAAVPPPAIVLPGDNIVATMIDGFIVGLPAEEWRLAAYHVFHGVLEPGLTRQFCESVTPGMVVVDIGANIGMYTLYAARQVGPEGCVYSFEPTPRTFAILRDNVQVNGLLETGRVRLHRVAVTDRRGLGRLAVFRANGGHNTLFPDGSQTDLIEVDTTTLDDALVGTRRVDVIKIDAEGAEPSIWSGMSQTLAHNPHLRVFMEFAPGHLRRAGQDPGAFLDRIAAAGFAIRLVDDTDGSLTEYSHTRLLSMPSSNLLVTRTGA